MTQTHRLLHGREAVVHGDSGYQGADKRAELVKVAFLIAQKPLKLRAMKNPRDRHYAARWEQHKASIRVKWSIRFV